MSGNLGCVVVSVDGNEGSMDALRWALDNIKLRPSTPGSTQPPGHFLLLHVQSPPSIAAGLNPGDIPFGGPTNLEVPAFTAAIEAHQKRITEAILNHALQICSEKKVNVKTLVVVGDPKEKICEVVENLHADLLVMGSRAFGPIKRMLLGKQGCILQSLSRLAAEATLLGAMPMVNKSIFPCRRLWPESFPIPFILNSEWQGVDFVSSSGNIANRT
ncbi:hypothetical protein V6N13_001710 [Hibiscus sabdariffa]